jgi:hypothetical protein
MVTAYMGRSGDLPQAKTRHPAAASAPSQAVHAHVIADCMLEHMRAGNGDRHNAEMAKGLS